MKEKIKIIGITRRTIEELLNHSNPYFKTACLNKDYFNIKILLWPLQFHLKKLESGKYCITTYNGDEVKHTIYTQEEFRDKVIIPSSLYVYSRPDSMFAVGETEQLERLIAFIKHNFKENKLEIKKIS
jgi:hypothetical protein